LYTFCVPGLRFALLMIIRLLVKKKNSQLLGILVDC
jgi:hypothetical protein